MTKRELVVKVASALGVTQHEVSDVVQTMLDVIVESLVEGQRLEIRDFGVFETRTRDARTGRNPRTGREVPISRKRVAAFRPGKALKERVHESGVGAPGPLAPEGAGEGPVAPLGGGDGAEGAADSRTEPAPAAGEQQSLF